MIRIGLLISLVCFIAAASFSAIGWFGTPEGASVPVHFNASGEADRYGSKAEAFLFMPLVLAGLTFLLSLAPAIDPRGKNIRRSRSLYIVVWMIGALSLVGAQGMTTFLALGGEIPPDLIARGIGIFISVVLLVIGFFIAKARPNFFAGVRTPWTLTSDLSWDKTHRWASRIFLILGLAGLVAGFLFPPEFVTYGLIGAVLTSSLGLVIYSFMVWKNDPARETLNPDDAD